MQGVELEKAVGIVGNTKPRGSGRRSVGKAVRTQQPESHTKAFDHHPAGCVTLKGS